MKKRQGDLGNINSEVFPDFKVSTVAVNQENPFSKLQNSKDKLNKIEPGKESNAKTMNSTTGVPISDVTDSVCYFLNENPHCLMPHEHATIDLKEKNPDNIVTYGTGITKTLDEQKSYTNKTKDYSYPSCLKHYCFNDPKKSTENNYLSSSYLQEDHYLSLNQSNEYFKVSWKGESYLLEKLQNPQFSLPFLNEIYQKGANNRDK